MPMSDLGAYNIAKSRSMRVGFSKQLIGLAASTKTHSAWMRNPNIGAAPSSPVVPARNLLGALGQPAGASKTLRLVGGHIQHNGNDGALMLIDRLSVQGGIVGNVGTVQTTNLPTAPLTRYTSGAGVHAALEVYALFGATPGVATVSYTDGAGNPAVSESFAVDTNTVGRFFQVPSAAGSSGFRSVESVTFSSTTTTGGNFGIVLYSVVAMLRLRADQIDVDSFLDMGEIPEVAADACLSFVSMSEASNNLVGSLEFGEDDV